MADCIVCCKPLETVEGVVDVPLLVGLRVQRDSVEEVVHVPCAADNVVWFAAQTFREEARRVLAVEALSHPGFSFLMQFYPLEQVVDASLFVVELKLGPDTLEHKSGTHRGNLRCAHCEKAHDEHEPMTVEESSGCAFCVQELIEGGGIG